MRIASQTIGSFAVSLFVLGFSAIPAAHGAPKSAADAVAFFETRIRPILAQECYECHREGSRPKSGLALDWRGGWETGGDRGPAIVPGDLEQSLMLQVLNGTHPELEMPKDRAPLEPSVIADFAQWIREGAIDPRDQPATEIEIATDTDWEAIRERRAQWWSFQPPVSRPLPPSRTSRTHPIDRFIDARLIDAGLAPNGSASPATLLRRLSFALRGLPPEPDVVAEFERDPSPERYNHWVDRWLDSTAFGERWARHWMDWVRYAESHGSEGDPKIPYAWRYRDSLIRAFNQDVPYDQLILEAVAGDRLAQPRIDPETGLNESAIGASQLRFVLHGFAPTDALDELVRFTNDQIDTVSKAFQGLTLSCARCHDHKFDAISQADFYSWFGVFASTRPGILRADVPNADERHNRDSLDQLKTDIRRSISSEWAPSALRQRIAERLSSEALETLEEVSATDWRSPSLTLSRKGADAFLAAIAPPNDSEPSTQERQPWPLPNDAGWTAFEGALAGRRPNAGGFSIAPEGDIAIAGIYPAGVYSHLHSDRDAATLQSPRFRLDGAYDLWVRIAGDGGSVARYAVQNYPRNGTVYPVERLNGGSWRWKRFPLGYWEGDRIHFEITTAADQPILANENASRSWFGIQEALLLPAGSPSPARSRAAIVELAAPLMVGTTKDLADAWIAALSSVAADAVDSWKNGAASDLQAEALDEMLQADLLANELSALPETRPLIERFRTIAGDLPTPVRVPGVLETSGFDQPLFDRGNHRNPTERIPRRFLEFLDPEPYATSDSGRLQLARDLIRPDNPFTARVAVNRVWAALFGRGIVATPDNFGRLGARPTHPELLDFLAVDFQRSGWSVKELIRRIVTSETWKASSVATPAAEAQDPSNQWLSHQNVRRLDAEAIRDHLLATSGALRSSERFGPPVNGEAPKRSVYLQVIRNRLDPFLSVFNAPAPTATQGRRDQSNVPEQALALLNNPFVHRQAEFWANATQSLDDEDRIARMWLQAFGRRIEPHEFDDAQRYIERMRAARSRILDQRMEASRNLEALTERLQALESLARDRALENRSRNSQDAAVSLPGPVVSWNFTQSLRDEVLGLEAEIQGDARLTPEGLELRGGHAHSAPLPQDFGAKTLEIRLKIDDLNQRGGGALSLQTLDGNVFDAIVYGEQQAGHWIAGSNFFERTEDFGGPKESAAREEPIHLAWVYSSDGTVTAFRNGELYGVPYQSNGLHSLKAGESQLLFGNRHGAPTGSRLFRGTLQEARLYDRALDAEVIEALHDRSTDFVSKEELLAAMEENERVRWFHYSNLYEESLHQKERLEAQPGFSDIWADYAHALINMKEFIYLP